MLKLSFGKGNAKLDKLAAKTGKQVNTFSIMSGHNCPYAKECHSKAVELPDGRYAIEDGPFNKFRCFSASQEVLFPNVRKQRQENGRIVELAAQSIDDAVETIVSQLPRKCGIMRIHVGGDFKTQAYFDTWLEVARVRKDIVFYAYTKSLPFWVKRLGSIPSNLVLTASEGGFKDSLIAQYGLRFAKVVFSKSEARKLKLPIDHDDSHAIKNGKSFALLLHGIQPKGTAAATALKKLKGVGSYGR